MVSSNPIKKPRLDIRQSIQLAHTSEETKRAFNDQLDNLKQALTPGSSNNLSLMIKLMEIAENHLSTCQVAHNVANPSTMFLKSAGKYKALSSWYQVKKISNELDQNSDDVMIICDRSVH